MSNRGHSGRFIVFEGIDGSGTSTQLERYAAGLRAKRRLVHVTREPSDGPIGSLLRLTMAGRINLRPKRMAQTMGLLFAADRLDHLASEIEPFLRDGAVVLSDRYDLSTIAYQWASASEAGDEDLADWLRSLNRFALRPDATVVLDVAPQTAEQRRRGRDRGIELYEESGLQTRLADLYREADKLLPGDRILHVDGDGSLDEVAQAITEVLEPIVEG